MTQKRTYTETDIDTRSRAIPEKSFWKYVFGDLMHVQPPTLDEVAFAETPEFRDIRTALHLCTGFLARFSCVLLWTYKILIALPSSAAAYWVSWVTRDIRRLMPLLVFIAAMHYSHAWEVVPTP